MTNENVVTPDKKRLRYKRSIDTPVIIAFFIVLVTICVLMVWQIFFDTGIKGDWHLRFTSDGKEYSYGLTFKDNNEFDYSFGGITYTGKYTLSPENAVLNLVSSSYGQNNINTDFQYHVVGNVFQGKGLVLVNSGNTELPFVSSDDYIPVVKYYSDFTADPQILGSWLYTDVKQGYNYTFTFYDDGRYEYLCDGSRHIGAYKAKDGDFTYNLVADGGVVNEETVRYSFNNGKLSLITDNFIDVLSKTDDKYSFKNEIN